MLVLNLVLQVSLNIIFKQESDKKVFLILKEIYKIYRKHVREKQTKKSNLKQSSSKSIIILVRQNHKFCFQLELLEWHWICWAMNDMAFRNRAVMLNDNLDFTLYKDFREKMYLFSLSLNTHEKAESKQTVPTVYTRKRFPAIITISWIFLILC